MAGYVRLDEALDEGELAPPLPRSPAPPTIERIDTSARQIASQFARQDQANLDLEAPIPIQPGTRTLGELAAFERDPTPVLGRYGLSEFPRPTRDYGPPDPFSFLGQATQALPGFAEAAQRLEFLPAVERVPELEAIAGQQAVHDLEESARQASRAWQQRTTLALAFPANSLALEASVRGAEIGARLGGAVAPILPGDDERQREIGEMVGSFAGGAAPYFAAALIAGAAGVPPAAIAGSFSADAWIQSVEQVRAAANGEISQGEANKRILLILGTEAAGYTPALPIALRGVQALFRAGPKVLDTIGEGLVRAQRATAGEAGETTVGGALGFGRGRRRYSLEPGLEQQAATEAILRRAEVAPTGELGRQSGYSATELAGQELAHMARMTGRSPDEILDAFVAGRFHPDALPFLRHVGEPPSLLRTRAAGTQRALPLEDEEARAPARSLVAETRTDYEAPPLATLRRQLTEVQAEFDRARGVGNTLKQDQLAGRIGELEAEIRTAEAVQPLPGQRGLFGEDVPLQAEEPRIEPPVRKGIPGMLGPEAPALSLESPPAQRGQLLEEPIPPAAPAAPVAEAPLRPTDVRETAIEPDPLPSTGTTQIDVGIDDLTFRPDLFQARDVDPARSFNQGQVDKLRRLQQRGVEIGPPTVVRDPENPGKYIVYVGHNRTELRRQAGETRVRVKLDPADIGNPEDLARLQERAVTSNYKTGTSFREDARAFAALEGQGRAVDEIRALTKAPTASRVEDVLDAARLGGAAIDRANLDKTAQGIASELGRGMRLFGINTEDANALFNRFLEPDPGGKVPSRTAVRDTVQLVGEKMRAGKQEGFGGFEGFGGEAVAILNEYAQKKAALERTARELTLMERKIKKTYPAGDQSKAARAARTVALDLSRRRKLIEKDLTRLEGGLRQEIRKPKVEAPADPGIAAAEIEIEARAGGKPFARVDLKALTPERLEKAANGDAHELQTVNGLLGNSTMPERLTPWDTPEIVEARRLAQEARPGAVAIDKQTGGIVNDTVERQRFRRELADRELAKPADEGRDAYVIIGPPASGKSSAITTRLAGYRAIDSDDFKGPIAQADGLTQNLEPGAGIYGGVVHDASDLVWLDVFDGARARGDNMALPLVGKNPDRIDQIGRTLVEDGYTVHLVLVDLPSEKAAARTATRFHDAVENGGGRLVDPQYVSEIDALPQETYARMKAKDWVYDYRAVSNDVGFGEEPLLIDEGSGARAGEPRPEAPGEPRALVGRPGPEPRALAEGEAPPDARAELESLSESELTAQAAREGVNRRWRPSTIDPVAFQAIDRPATIDAILAARGGGAPPSPPPPVVAPPPGGPPPPGAPPGGPGRQPPLRGFPWDELTADYTARQRELFDEAMTRADQQGRVKGFGTVRDAITAGRDPQAPFMTKLRARTLQLMQPYFYVRNANLLQERTLALPRLAHSRMRGVAASDAQAIAIRLGEIGEQSGTFLSERDWRARYRGPAPDTPEQQDLVGYIGDVIERPEAYDMPVQTRRFIEQEQQFLLDRLAFARSEGVDIQEFEGNFITHIYKAKQRDLEVADSRPLVRAALGAKQATQKHRIYGSYWEAAGLERPERRLVPEFRAEKTESQRGAFETMTRAHQAQLGKQIADQRTLAEVRKLGRGAEEGFAGRQLRSSRVPALSGTLFPHETAAAIDDMLGPEDAGGFARVLLLPSEIAKTTMATLDASPLVGIQGARRIMDNPATGFLDVGRATHLVFSDDAWRGHMLQNWQAYREAARDGVNLFSDFHITTEGTQPGLLQSIPVFGKKLRSLEETLYGRGVAMYKMLSYVEARAQVEALQKHAPEGLRVDVKGRLARGETPGQIAAQHANNVYGGLERALRGQSAGYQAFERFMFFAPDFLRAQAGLLATAAGKPLTPLGAMTLRFLVGGMALVAVASELGTFAISGGKEHANLDDPRLGDWFALKTPAGNISLAGPLRTYFRTAFNVAADIKKEDYSRALGELDFFRRTRAGPIPAQVEAQLRNRDVLGRPVTTSRPQTLGDIRQRATFAAQRTLPFSAQQTIEAIQKGGAQAPLIAGAGAFGFSVFPERIRTELNNEAQKRFGLDYNELTPGEKVQLADNSTVKRALSELDQEQQAKADAGDPIAVIREAEDAARRIFDAELVRIEDFRTQDWRTAYTEAREARLAALDALRATDARPVRDFFERLDKREPETPRQQLLFDYFAIFDTLKDPTTGRIPSERKGELADELDAYEARLDETQLSQLLEDLGARDTPRQAEYRADVRYIADTGYWDVRDIVFDELQAPLEGQTAALIDPAYGSYDQWRRETLRAIEDELRDMGQPIEAAGLIFKELPAEQLMSEVTSDVRSALRDADAQLTQLLIKWGYKTVAGKDLDELLEAS